MYFFCFFFFEQGVCFPDKVRESLIWVTSASAEGTHVLGQINLALHM